MDLQPFCAPIKSLRWAFRESVWALKWECPPPLHPCLPHSGASSHLLLTVHWEWNQDSMDFWRRSWQGVWMCAARGFIERPWTSASFCLSASTPLSSSNNILSWGETPPTLSICALSEVEDNPGPRLGMWLLLGQCRTLPWTWHLVQGWKWESDPGCLFICWGKLSPTGFEPGRSWQPWPLMIKSTWRWVELRVELAPRSGHTWSWFIFPRLLKLFWAS